MSSISTKILKLWIAIQITSPFPFPFRIQSSRKKKRHLTPPPPPPLPSRFTLRHARTRFIRVPFCSSRECYEEKKRGQRGGVFRGGRKIDIATRTLGYSVNDDKRLPRTITADNGKNHCWKRREGREGGFGIPLQGDVAKNKRPWGKRNSEIRENSCGEGTNRMEINTGISLRGYLRISLFQHVSTRYFYIPFFFFSSYKNWILLVLLICINLIASIVIRTIHVKINCRWIID